MLKKSIETRAGEKSRSVAHTHPTVSQAKGIETKKEFHSKLASKFEEMHSPISYGNEEAFQLKEGAANWDTMSKYNSGTAAAEVTAAFTKAGYVFDGKLLILIIRLMDSNGFGNEKWAHGKGDDSGSGKQGDTDERIQACKKWLIAWAGSNPADGGGGSSSGGKSKVSKEKQQEQKETKAKKKAAVKGRKEEKQKDVETDKARLTLLKVGIAEDEIDAFVLAHGFVPDPVTYHAMT